MTTLGSIGTFNFPTITNNFVHYFILIYQEPIKLLDVRLGDLIFCFTKDVNKQNKIITGYSLMAKTFSTNSEQMKFHMELPYQQIKVQNI